MTRALGFESLLYDEQDDVATMTLNRPAGLVFIPQALVEVRNVASHRVVKRGLRREGHLHSYLVVDGHRAEALICSLLAEDLDAPNRTDSPLLTE